MYSELLVVEESIQKAYETKGQAYLARCFFVLFFEQYPETQEFFKTTDVDQFGPQKIKYISDFVIDTIRHAEFAENQIITEVVRHQVYGLKDKEYYYCLLDSFQQSVKQCLDEDSWTADLDAAWNVVIQSIRGQIQMAVTEYL